MAVNVMSMGIDTSDATATAGTIRNGYTAYVDGVKVTGNIQDQAAQTITPGKTNKTIASGKYLAGTQTIAGDANLVAGNIKSGVSIFGVSGTATTVDGEIGYEESSGGVRKLPSTPSSLSQSRQYFSAVTAGNYALFGGGLKYISSSSGYSYYSTVDAYDTSLIRSTPTVLSSSRAYLESTTVGNYGLFGGGSTSTVRNGTYTNYYYSTVDAYDTSLSRSTPTTLSQSAANLAATTVGNYGLFGGGYNNGTYYSTVDAYNKSLTKSTPTALSSARASRSATVGNYALFGGVYNGSSNIATVDAYNKSLTRSTPTALSIARGNVTSVSVGNCNYALFAGGCITNNMNYTSYSTVDVYDTSLTRSTTNLSSVRYSMGSTPVGKHALFAGGQSCNGIYSTNNIKYYNTVEVYDDALARSLTTELSCATDRAAATSIGSLAIIGIGWDIDNTVIAGIINAYVGFSKILYVA